MNKRRKWLSLSDLTPDHSRSSPLSEISVKLTVING